MPALVLLVVFKIIADLRAHYGEHSTSTVDYTASE
jgi:hypothetical protein